MKETPISAKGAGCLALLLCLFSSIFLSACSALPGAMENVTGTADVTKYYTYGLFFQLEGQLERNPKDPAPERVSFLLRKGSGEEDEVYRADLPFSVSKGKDRLTFRTTGKIDEGLCLDTLPKGTYVALLETEDKEGNQQTLALQDATGSKDQREEPIEYYTLTHGRSHRKVTTDFSEVSGGKSTLVFQVSRSRLPDNVYDIVVDPGHGGKDPGAQSGGHNEADIVLDQAKVLKSVLEQAGYKVLLTRDGSEDPEVNLAYTAYDKDGRVNLAGASKAKLSFSIHLNHSPNNSQKGVQIYRSKKAGDALAGRLAEELVNGTGLTYSTMAGKSVPGVYTRTFSATDLREERAKAKSKGFPFYNATTATDYYFMIREFGGLATGAYVDGRNPDYGVNEYRNSNQGVEGLLCELGFMTNAQDLTVLLDNQRGLAKRMTAALDRYVADLYEETPAEDPSETDPPAADLLGKERL